MKSRQVVEALRLHQRDLDKGSITCTCTRSFGELSLFVNHQIEEALVPKNPEEAYYLPPKLKAAWGKYNEEYISGAHKADFPDEKRFNKEDARAIWGALGNYHRDATHAETVAMMMAQHMDRESGAHWGRCSVCGAWRDPECVTEC